MKKTVVVILGVLLAFIVGAILLSAQGYHPIESYISMFKNSLLTKIALGNTLARMAIFIMLGLAAYFGFNSGVSNLGLFGQLLMGTLVATLIGQHLNASPVIAIPLMLIAAAIAGGIYAGIAALFRLGFGMNEFITTLMMNFIAKYLIAYLVTNPMRDPNSQWPMSRPILQSNVFSRIGDIDMTVFLAILIFIIVFLYWNFTRRGYEFRLTGANNLFARLGGCEVNKNFFSSMVISGVLAGIAGAFLIMGSTQQNKLIPNLGETNASDGLMIAIISGQSMPSVLFFSLFFGIIQTGSVGMQMDTNVPSEFTVMLQAIMVLFVVAFRDYSELFINLIKARSKSRKLRTEDHEPVC